MVRTSKISSKSKRPSQRVAVVGAGVAGLSCAQTLSSSGVDVEVFDKSRGPSGRMSTRRVPALSVQADHGAQYFTAKSKSFQSQTELWLQQGIIAAWDVVIHRIDKQGHRTAAPRPPVNPRYVGSPRMSAVGRHLSAGLELRTSVRITAVEEDVSGGWHLIDEDGQGHGPFDSVMVAVPAPQAEPLLATRPKLASLAAAAAMEPCQTLMMLFDEPLSVSWDAATVSGSALAWVARDSSKPGRPPGNVWVAQSSAEHAQEFLEESSEESQRRLLAAFQEVTRTTATPTWSTAHRWRFARPAVEPANEGLITGLDKGLGVCGDWLCGPRVEAAWLSGRALAERLLAIS